MYPILSIRSSNAAEIWSGSFSQNAGIRIALNKSKQTIVATHKYTHNTDPRIPS